MNETKPFIPSTFDDFGFTPAQYRVACRVTRRGDCFESIPNMAAGCKLAVKTVKAAVRTLTNSGVFEKQSRPGRTSIFKLAPFAQWQRPSPKETLGVRRPDTQAKRHPSGPTQKTPHKGNPIKVNPIKGINPLEKMEGWQLRKDLKETTDPIEREAIKAEIKMREGSSNKPIIQKLRPRTVAPVVNRPSVEEMRKKWNQAIEPRMTDCPPPGH